MNNSDKGNNRPLTPPLGGRGAGIERVIASIRNVPDFPKPGILFKDISTALKDAEVLKFIADELYEYYKDKGITKVVGVESRGFVLGSILAYKLGAGFVLLRKPGKLPSETFPTNTTWNMAATRWKFTKMQLKKMMWFCCTMTFWLQAEVPELH